MKISILLPVFNTAPYLRDCLDSILAQAEENWELLAVDDFSTDNSLSILKEYAKMDNRIQVLLKSDPSRVTKNPKSQKGISPSLRLAFQNSAGHLVTRMDSDDRMLPDKLAELKKLLLDNGRGNVATGLVEYFSADGLGEGYRLYAAWLNEVALKGRHTENIYRECVVPSPCWMAWREDLEAIGAFQEDVYPEDYDLCFRFCKAGLKIVSAPQVLHQWRDRPDRTSRTDEMYRDNSYLDLKALWFLRLDYDPARPLVLWGAGRKGKRLAKMLAEKSIEFHWVCNNPVKWGRRISERTLESFEILPQLTDPQVIVAVAGPEDQQAILDFLKRHSFEAGNHFFFFC